MSKNILLINDYSGYQEIALAAQSPILKRMGHEVFRLPSVLLSTPLNYSPVARLDTTDFMREAAAAWDRLGFAFHAVATGYVTGTEQAFFLKEYCARQRSRGALYFCDPVMADNGKCYSGITDENIQNMRELASVADYATPNYTEACLLTDTPWREYITEEDAKMLLERLRHLGVLNPVITSVPLECGNVVAGYDAITGDCFIESFERIPVACYGTGDSFLAFLIGHVLAGEGLRQSVVRSMRAVEEMIRMQ